MTTLMLPDLSVPAPVECLPAVGVALKPQLQVILAKSLSFEAAQQLMYGCGETRGKGFGKRPRLLTPGWLWKPA